MTTNHPSADQWTPNCPPPLAPRRDWPTVALAGVAAVLSAVGLIVALTHPATDNPPGETTAAPKYTAAENTAAHKKLCDVYELAARSVQKDTNGGDPALAGVSTVNGALMLEQAVNSAPALAPADRAAALALAAAYTNANAMGSLAHRDDSGWLAVVDGVNATDARMKAVCGGG